MKGPERPRKEFTVPRHHYLSAVCAPVALLAAGMMSAGCHSSGQSSGESIDAEARSWLDAVERMDENAKRALEAYQLLEIRVARQGLHHTSPAVRLWSASTLADPIHFIGMPELREQKLAAALDLAIDPLARALREDPEAAVRRDAARALGMIGLAAMRARPALDDSERSDQDPAVRQAAADAIQQISRKPLFGTGGVEAPPPKSGP